MEVLIEFLKFFSSLAWPVMVFAVFWLFRKEISAAIPNVTEAGPGGVKLGQQATKAISTYSAKGELKKFPSHLPRTPLLEKVETNLHETLKLYKDDEQIDIVVRELAVQRVLTACESVWGSIYQSQLNALLLLQKRQLPGELPVRVLAALPPGE